MIRRAAPAAPSQTVHDIAGRWFARRRSGRMSADETAELEAWLAREPAHREALEAIERAWSTIEGARRAPEILALRERGRGRIAGVSRVAVGRLAAACLALAVLAGGGWEAKQAGLLDMHRFTDARYATAVGEKTTLALPDGSMVTLNTDTVLRTAAARGRRMVYLDRGQAFFRVAKDADRPFMVHAAGRTVVAVGTAFDVRVDGRRFEVTLVEGKVRVETPEPRPPSPPSPRGEAPAPAPAVRTTEMLAGDRFVASTGAQWVMANVDTTKPTNWLIGRLKFEGEPMGSVAAEFGRYSARKVVIADPDLARRPISGTFEAGDAEAFAQALEVAGLARIESSSEAVIRLVPPAK